MAIKTFTTGEVLTAADTNTYLANSALVFVKSQTIGSAVSSVTVSDAFSSTYDNYRIMITGGTGSLSCELKLQLGSTVTDYYYSYIFTSWSATVNADGLKTATAFFYVGGQSSNTKLGDVTVYSPFLTTNTRVFAGGFGQETSYVGSMSGALFNSTSYTSFIISPSSGTMTGGTITVYGYRKA